jgi:hypothetical protein
VAEQLQVNPDGVPAISRFIGGTFDSKGPNPRSSGSRASSA